MNLFEQTFTPSPTKQNDRFQESAFNNSNQFFISPLPMSPNKRFRK